MNKSYYFVFYKLCDNISFNLGWQFFFKQKLEMFSFCFDYAGWSINLWQK